MHLPIKLKTSKTKTVTLSFDAEKFERLAAHFGYFNPDFLKSLARSERDYKKGKVKKLSSLKGLR